MLLDSQNLFSDNQTITATAASQNIIKFGKGDVSFLPFFAQVTSDFDNLTSLTIALQTSNSEDFSTPTTLIESKLLLAQLKAGNKFPISQFPKGNQGYMRILYTIEGTAPTTGAITAGATFSNLE